MLKDYYSILGVAEDASPAEIKLQYQKLLLIVMSHFILDFFFVQHNKTLFLYSPHITYFHPAASSRQAAAEAARTTTRT